MRIAVDGHDYRLRHGGDAGWILNRKPSAEAGWDPSPPPTRDRRELIWNDVERELISEAQAEELLRDLS